MTVVTHTREEDVAARGAGGVPNKAATQGRPPWKDRNRETVQMWERRGNEERHAIKKTKTRATRQLSLDPAQTEQQRPWSLVTSAHRRAGRQHGGTELAIRPCGWSRMANGCWANSEGAWPRHASRSGGTQRCAERGVCGTQAAGGGLQMHSFVRRGRSYTLRMRDRGPAASHSSTQALGDGSDLRTARAARSRCSSANARNSPKGFERTRVC